MSQVDHWGVIGVIRIIKGDCIESLKKLDDKSVNTCITSPPYWGLRDYGTAEWVGGDPECPHFRQSHHSEKTNTGHKKSVLAGGIADSIYKKECKDCGAIRKDSQLGLEETPEEFVENLVKVFREVKRVLRDDGTVWLNLGDSYVGGGRGWQYSKEGTIQQAHIDAGVKYGSPTGKIDGLKPKDLVGIPFRVAFALQADGWYLRQDIIWHKPNPMPESVTDRCTKAHEYIFLLSKSPKYYFDNEAIKEDAVGERWGGNNPVNKENSKYKDNKYDNGTNEGRFIYDKRNKRSVWTVTTKPFKGAHFATFPMDLIEPCISAGCPEKICDDCGKPYERVMQKPKQLEVERNKRSGWDDRKVGGVLDKYNKENPPIDLGVQKQCDCKTNKTKAGTVLDPFAGSGTTGIVAAFENRNAVLCELNEEYIKVAKERINAEVGLWGEVVED